MRDRILPALGALVALGALTLARADDGMKPVVNVPRLPRAPVLDEFLAMAPPPELAAAMAHVDGGFLQREPIDGAPASQHTDVWLGYDDERLYAVFVAFDAEPDKIRARMSRRESFFGDDIVHLQIDTFADERRAYTFICNPLGVQFDAMWIEGSDFDGAFDTVWDSRGELTERGYVVWMAIPFKSLRFPDRPEQSWGLILNRDIPRNNEESFWPGYTLRIQGRLNQSGRLTGLRDISPGRNLQFIPYAAARSFELLDPAAATTTREDEFDAGLDAKFVFRDSLVLDLTANPDFSQVESDEPQLTVNERFEVFFPEKRPFFLENASYFATPQTLLFTRRIRDPLAGGRLTGKLGPWALGVLATDDEAPGKLAPAGSELDGKSAIFGALRANRDLFEQSTLGLTYVERDLDDSYNRVASVDGRLRWGDHWNTVFQAVGSESRGLDGARLSGAAYDVSHNRTGRHFTSHTHYIDIAPGFRAAAGFVPRVDIRELHQELGYTLRPEGKHLLAWTPSAFLQWIEDHDGTRLDWQVEPRLGWELRRQTNLQVGYRFGQELVRPQDFPGLTTSLDFDVDQATLELESTPFAGLELGLAAGLGTTVNYVPPVGALPAEAEIAEARLALTLRSGRWRFDMSYLGSRLDEPDGGRIFANDIARLKAGLQIDPKLSLRLIVERDDLRIDPGATSLAPRETVNADLLVTYLVNPWTALYVGYNSNWRDLERIDTAGGPSYVPSPGSLLQDAEQVFAKFSYLIRP